MEPPNDATVKKRHYSTIGIHNVFLSPVELDQLPQSYLACSTSRRFVSPEIIGVVKTEPEDFIVRELASDKLQLPAEWRVADLRNPAIASEDLPNSKNNGDAVLKPMPPQDTLAVEKKLDPLEVVRRVLTAHHPETCAEELVALETLQQQALLHLKELGSLDLEKATTATIETLWIPPIPVDSSCFASTSEAASTKIRLVGGGDRGSLHRCLKQAFPLLQSDTKKRDGDDDGDPWIKVSMEDSFFGLVAHVCSPAHEYIQGLYQFRNRGLPDASAVAAAQIKKKDAGTVENNDTKKRKRFYDRSAGYSEDDPFQFVLPLRTGLNKDERRKMHHLISGRTRDFETSTISGYRLPNSDSASEVSALVLKWSKSAKRGASKTSRSKSCVLFVLKKRQKEHLTALQILTRTLRCRQSDLGIAGIKDMHAVTYQYLTVRGKQDDRMIARVNDDLEEKGMELRKVRQVDHFLQPGDLKGNHFVIVVRNLKMVQVIVDKDNNRVEEVTISCDREHILARAKAVRSFGFVNFYGEQRVGIAGDMDVVGVRSFDIGRAMLQGDFDKAIDLLMTGRLICRGLDDLENPQARKARQIWKETKGDVEETYKALPKGDSLARERTVLQGLKRYQNSLEALKCLHFRVRTFWINAYQSYIWNKMASERLDLYGSKVVLGDLILGDDGGVMIVTDDLLSSTQLKQVVLPLPGYNVQYPTNDLGRRYTELLKNEHVKFEKDARLEATAKGSYRQIIVAMDTLKVEFPSESPESDSANSFEVSFDLPSGSYATMLLRELMVTTVTRL